MNKKRNKRTPSEVAYEIDDYLQSACSEGGHAEYGYNTKGDCEADRLYGDEEYISDLAGDAISWIVGVDHEFRAKVCEELKKITTDVSGEMWDRWATKFRENQATADRIGLKQHTW